MFKELVIAIILGAIIGLGVTFGLNKFSKNNSSNFTTNTPTPIATLDLTPTTTKQTHILEITSPQTDIVTKEANLDIIGITSPQSQIVIHTNSDTVFTQSDDTGNFSQNIEIEAGINVIQISSFSEDEEKIETDLQITLSTADF